MNKLLIATTNKGKIRELHATLRVDNLGLQLLTPADIGLNLEVEEDGSTYAENATKKALAFARASGLTSLADDSGLEVDALDGAPGLFSARYSAKPGATDADRRAYLLENLRGKPRPWKARFVATVAIAGPEGSVELAEGTCPGEIIPEERGSGGFGYDPIFFLPELGKTMAELPEETKNHLSHRARAVQAAKPILMSLFNLYDKLTIVLLPRLIDNRIHKVTQRLSEGLRLFEHHHVTGTRKGDQARARNMISQIFRIFHRRQRILRAA